MSRPKKAPKIDIHNAGFSFPSILFVFFFLFFIHLVFFTDKKDCKHGLTKLKGSFISGIYSSRCFLPPQEIYVDINFPEILSTKHTKNLFV